MAEQDVIEKKQKTAHKTAADVLPSAQSQKIPNPQINQTVWVLADDRPGNVSQALGIAQALRMPFEVKKISYDAMAKLPNLVRGSSLIGVKPEARVEIKAPWPNMVIAAGRRTAPVARYIRKQSKGLTKLVQCMWPGGAIDEFDLLVMPEHDNRIERANIFKTLGAPNGITADRLERERFRWEREFAYLPQPLVAVLVGGGSKHAPFTKDDAYQLAQKLNLLMQGGGGLLITTSRRSSAEVLKVLKQNLKPHFYLYDWVADGENPYLGFLAHAEAIVVTGDSIGMCSEACSTGKPVYIFNPSGQAAEKMQIFQAQLFEYGCAKPLQGEFNKWHYKPLNEAKKVAEAIREKFL